MNSEGMDSSCRQRAFVGTHDMPALMRKISAPVQARNVVLVPAVGRRLQLERVILRLHAAGLHVTRFADPLTFRSKTLLLKRAV